MVDSSVVNSTFWLTKAGASANWGANCSAGTTGGLAAAAAAAEVLAALARADGSEGLIMVVEEACVIF